MDLDVAQVRAFVATVEHRHFGRAASQLFITQQSLSKRVQRLEQVLGQRLLARSNRGVELTEAGRRFLPHARQLLSSSDAAVAAVRQRPGPVRVDVWGHVQPPMRVLRRLVEQAPELQVEASMRRSLTAAIQALQRNEIDAAFGRVRDLGHPWPVTLTHGPLLLTPAAVAVGAGHPLAAAAAVRPPDLRPYRLWLAASGAPEMVGWFRRFAERFDITLDAGGHHLGVGDVIDGLRGETARFGLVAADGPSPAGIRRIPLHPRPVYPWSLVWRGDDRHPLLELLIRLVERTGSEEGWLDYDAERDWLPDVDRLDVTSQSPPPTAGRRAPASPPPAGS